MARPAEFMLDALRTSLVRSHAGAAAILFLLFYAFAQALGLAMLPAWGIAQMISAAMVRFGWLDSTLLGDGYWQLRVFGIVRGLARIAFYYALAWLLSQWLYGTKPVQAIARYRQVFSRKSHG